MIRTSITGPIARMAAILLAAALLIAPAASAADTYKIGGLFSSTGRASFLGDPEKKTMEMVVEAINAGGGIDGHMIEAIIYDTEGDPGKAVSGVNKLLHKDRVLAIVGPSTTPTTLAVISFAQKARVPLISCAAGIKITTPVKPWIFKTAQSDVLAVAAVYRKMKAEGVKSVGILTVANAFGESGRTQLLDQAKANGIEVARAESFGAKDTDMTAQLTKIRTANPDAIVCWGTNPGPAVVAKNAAQLKLTIPIYQSHGVASPKFIELAGPASEKMRLPTGKILVHELLDDSDPQKAVLASYVADYEKTYQMPVSGFGGYAYDAMRILEKALAGTNGDRKKLRDNIENLTGYVGTTGTFNFSASDHNGLGEDAFVMVEIKDGTWQVLH